MSKRKIFKQEILKWVAILNRVRPTFHIYKCFIISPCLVVYAFTYFCPCPRSSRNFILKFIYFILFFFKQKWLNLINHSNLRKKNPKRSFKSSRVILAYFGFARFTSYYFIYRKGWTECDGYFPIVMWIT